ncbi:MAG: sugar-transfer associated ATP-grasp domain-containing protein [Oscillospiraceae bacterium]|nr:sugar-transfer associated ATP-grasp domain-containing protein [Oscillospiraceae bacterium]
MDIKYFAARIREIKPEELRSNIKSCAAASGKAAVLIAADMLWCGLRYAAGPTDYRYCEFYSVPAEKRGTYITRGVNNELVRRFNDPLKTPIFDNKVEFARRFGQFFGRLWLDVETASLSDYERLCAPGGAVFAKTLWGTGGLGVKRLELEDFASASELKAYVESAGFGIVEQEARQCDELAGLYPGAVNTLRMVTLPGKSGPRLAFATLRIGNGSYVDNLHSGGMAALVDVNTGEVKSAAVDKAHGVYERHPATGHKIKGFKIPRWEDCVKTVLAAARVLPQVGYVGWDICVGERGPLLIEGNCFPGHDIYQMPHIMAPDYTGALPDFERCLGKSLGELRRRAPQRAAAASPAAECRELRCE